MLCGAAAAGGGATASSIQSCTHFVALMCSVAFCCPSSFCFSLSCSLCVLIWVSLVRSRVTLLLLFLGQVSFRRLLVAGKTLIFQFVAEFSVIFLLPQFGARSVVVVSLCVFFLSRCFFLLLPFSFFFALQLFALRFSFPRFVVVSFVQCNKFHLTANEGTRHPPTATDGLLPSLSFSFSLSPSLVTPSASCRCCF